MSLHDMVANIITNINPMMQCQWQKCTGLTTAVGGKQSPSYAAAATVSAQVQQLSIAELKHMNDMNMAGISRKVWCDAQLTGVDRAAQLGGDLIALPDGTIWLVVEVLESWPDWCSALLKKQVA